MSQAQADKVTYVTIRYDDGGVPVAAPAELHVKAGTRITWINDPAQEQEFTLAFADRVPDKGPPTKCLKAKREGKVYRATIIATPASAGTVAPKAQGKPPPGERYSYEVRAGDQASDPVIIIDK